MACIHRRVPCEWPLSSPFMILPYNHLMALFVYVHMCRISSAECGWVRPLPRGPPEAGERGPHRADALNQAV
jgi:hypothetical protein